MSAVSRDDSKGVWKGPRPLLTTVADATAGMMSVAAAAHVMEMTASAAVRRSQAAAARQHSAATARTAAAGRSQAGRPVPLAGSSHAAYAGGPEHGGAEREPRPDPVTPPPGECDADAQQPCDRG